MDVIEKVSADTRPDRHLIVDAAELAWGAHTRSTHEQQPTAPAARSDLGPGLSESNARPQVYRASAYAEFEVNGDTGEVVVKIIDASSGRIVRTVPADELGDCLRSGDDWTRRWRVYI